MAKESQPEEENVLKDMVLFVLIPAFILIWMLAAVPMLLSPD